ncbi:adenosine receptor A1b isoform X2 [Esox lucius]|uniref:adenosine receptor A1b isoform X2 n=1 Tax=Esox lucius TaxID=8010 RepID=UPI0014771328|nr:adenosine receptor A1b isoform X2 [Esox lucius]
MLKLGTNKTQLLLISRRLLSLDSTVPHFACWSDYSLAGAGTRCYKRVVTKQRAAVAVVVCWTVAFIVGLTPMLGWNNLWRLQQNGSLKDDLIITCQFENVISMDYMVYFNFFGWVLPPLLLMLLIYAEIFYMIHKQLNKKACTTSHADPNRYYDKELKLAKSLALVLFLFAVSWLPLHVINCITLFCPTCDKPLFLLYIAILLTHGNSAVNPIVYAFRIKKFRDAFLKIWKQYFCCKDGPAMLTQTSEKGRKEDDNPNGNRNPKLLPPTGPAEVEAPSPQSNALPPKPPMEHNNI